MAKTAELAHNRHTRKEVLEEVLELARAALSIRDDYTRALRRWPEDSGAGPQADHLSVALPFSPVYRPDFDAKPTAAQQAMMRWRSKVEDYLERLRDHYAFRGQPARLERFGVAQYDFGPVTGGDRLIAVLNRQLDLFARELAASDPGVALELKLDAGELPKLLRDARNRHRFTQAEAAVKLAVPEETYKSWELGRNKPMGRNRPNVESFVRKALLNSK